MDRFDWLEPVARPDHGARQPRDRAEPHDAASFYRAAREMRAAGHFVAAAAYYRRAVGLHGHHYDAWVELVDTLVRAGDLRSADSASEEAWTNYRQVRRLYAARALALTHLKRIREAKELLVVALEGGESAWYARCVAGEAILRTNPRGYWDALELFEEALELSDRPWEVFLHGGWALLDGKLPAVAASHFAEAAHQRPRAAVCWLGLADSFHALRLFEQARFYYERALEVEPTCEAALAGQRQCGRGIFGLMRGFRKGFLRRRWREEFEKLQGLDDLEDL